MGTASHHGLHRRGARHDPARHRRHPGRACRPPARGGSDRRARGQADRLASSRPTRSSTPKSVENALRVLLAIGGSTNAIIHLTAIAGRAGVPMSLQSAERALRHHAGAGEPEAGRQRLHGGFLRRRRRRRAAARTEADLLHLDCHDGHRRDAWASGLRARAATVRSTARSSPRATSRSSRRAGWSRCSAILAPQGAILKRSAADAELFEHEGRAVVFSSLEDLAARIDDPALDVTPDDILVLQNAGPHSPAACRRPAICRSRRSSRTPGVKDMVRVSDARMSGTAFGTIVLHVTPDAASGGPLALVRNGDRIRLSVKERRIDLARRRGRNLKHARRCDISRRRPATRLREALRAAKSSAPTRAATSDSSSRAEAKRAKCPVCVDDLLALAGD